MTATDTLLQLVAEAGEAQARAHRQAHPSPVPRDPIIAEADAIQQASAVLLWLASRASSEHDVELILSLLETFGVRFGVIREVARQRADELNRGQA